MAVRLMGYLALSILVTLATEPVPLVSPPMVKTTDVPPAPEPDPEPVVRGPTVNPFGPEPEIDDGRFEIGGFMKRPPPRPPNPAAPSAPERGALVWGPHDVAPWKRKGLIASAFVSGAGVVGAIATWPIAQHRLDRVERRIDELRRRGLNVESHPRAACRDVELGLAPRAIVTSDVDLGQRCLEFKRMRALHGVAIGIAVTGAVSAVTFAILHRVHRSDTPRRFEARSDGFALRF